MKATSPCRRCPALALSGGRWTCERYRKLCQYVAGNCPKNARRKTHKGA